VGRVAAAAVSGVSEYRVPAMPPARLGTGAEARDPRAATTPTGWQAKGQPMVQQWDADAAVEWGYLANTFVKACVDAIAADLSRLPLRVGDPTTNSYDKNHPLAKRFGPPPGGPNPQTSARKLLAWSVVQYVLTGRLGWEVELPTGGGDPVAYWPLPAGWLKAVPSQSGARYFEAFDYGPAHNPTRLPAERVFYLHDPAPDDWRQAVPRIQAARLDISIAVMQDRYDYAFLQNDSTPANVVVHEAFKVKEERDAWRRQFLSSHRGPDRAGRTAFTEAVSSKDAGVKGALEVIQLGMSAKDARSRELYDAKLRGICVATGVPVSRIGDSSDRTFSNAGQEWVNYWQGTLLPIALDFADAMAMQLMPMYSRQGGVPYFDTTDVAALQDARPAPTDIPGLVQAGVVLASEARAWLGLDPDAELPDPPPALPPGGMAARPKAEARAALGPAEREARAATIWRSANAAMQVLEVSWRADLQRMFRRQERATIDRLEGKRGRQLLASDERAGGAGTSNLFDPGFWTASSAEMLEGQYAQVWAVAGARVSDQFGIAFDLEQPGVADAIAQRAHDLAGQVTDTTYRSIRDQLAEGVANGEDIPSLAGRIQSVFADASDRRATTIARTEVISGFNAAQNTVAGQLPADVVGGQEWIATRDDRTRDEHIDADGQVIAMDESFDVGGEALAYPGDDAGSAWNVINCRCTVAFLTPDEYAEVRANEADPAEVTPSPEPAADAGSILEPDGPAMPRLPFHSSISDALGETERVTGGSVSHPHIGKVSSGSGRVCDAIEAAKGHIDALLRIPEEISERVIATTNVGVDTGGQLPVTVGKLGTGGSGTQGFFSTTVSDPRGVQIAVKSTATNPHTTFVHEFGHFLDFGDFGTGGEFAASAEQLPVLQAMRDSDAAATVRGYYSRPNRSVVTVMIEGEERGWILTHSHLDYLLGDDELWARGFTQWVAERSGDKTMQTELAKLLEHGDRLGLPTQWTPEDFAPIREAFDRLFASKGMLR
jgi:phage portal protein BeeE